ncbi:LuxR C-terminal-related transcriptional regulator [Sulfurimonas sp.]|uniref:response regulator transcription factor n=1 Tax=Sulfurimonas sp. TaxID=2022749 RepID=UPI002609D144|nr:LuxR C-terminal-related transcriptional regulator [Sulfurimonas sp.]
MQTIFLSTDMDMISEWKMRHGLDNTLDFDECDALLNAVKELDKYIIVADYDTVSHSINKMIAANLLPQRVIVLERVPEIITGKMLISKGVKAYGNSRMLKMHYEQMIEAVEDDKVWTYPELTLALTKNLRQQNISQEAQSLIQRRLTAKEQEVVYAVLQGLTNDAIANELHITPRTVKAHIGSVFSKLHVNDRVSLILLLR